MHFEFSVPQYVKMLTNLSNMLDKAAAHADAKKFDINNIMTARLAPDMFHCIKQIQIACDAAKFSAARMAGQQAPSDDDSEKTFAEIKARVARTIAYLNTMKRDDFKDAGERRISNPRWEGKTVSGTESLIEVSLPNFYFHIAMAYAILRHNGVEVGKNDYLGALPLK